MLNLDMRARALAAIFVSLAVLASGAGAASKAQRRARAEKLKQSLAGSEADRAEFERLHAESKRVMDALDTPRVELQSVSKRLLVAIPGGGLDEIDALLKERAEVLARLGERHKELYDLLPDIRALNKREEIGAWGGLLTGSPDKGTFSRVDRGKELYAQAHRFYKQVRTESAQEELLFQEQLKQIARRRGPIGRLRGKDGVIAALAAALLGALALLLRGRRFGFSTVEPAVAALLPGPSGPGSAPAGLLAGGYRIESELGRGAMGIVYGAVDLRLGRQVAIKKMREELRRNPKDLELFLAEARMVAAFSHPNIVQIFTIFEEGGEIFLVFERLGGSPLNELLDRERRLSFAAARRMTRQIGSALDYAHERKVIHRDLKTANIMVAGDGTAKVMDFGIAHQVHRAVARLTRAESWGTPPYMAPEQELGAVSRESDLFSLGVCFYEMVTGRLPFDGPNFLAQKREMFFPPPSRLVADLPAAVDAAVRRIFAPEPDGRFHSAAEFMAALDVPDSQAAG